MGILLVYDVTDERSFGSTSYIIWHNIYTTYHDTHTHARLIDVRNWFSNIEQHASEGVNKILIGNKCDMEDKRAITTEQGQALANELGIRFMETSAKANIGVEEAFFDLAR